MLERSTYNNSYVAGQHQWITTCTGDFGHFRITSENQHSAMTRFPGKLFSRLAWLRMQSGVNQMFLEMYRTSWTCNDSCISKMHWKVECLQGHHLNSSRASDLHCYLKKLWTYHHIQKLELFTSHDAWFSLWLKQCKHLLIGRETLIESYCITTEVPVFWIGRYVKVFVSSSVDRKPLTREDGKGTNLW